MSIEISRFDLFPTMVFEAMLPSSDEINVELLAAIEAERASDPNGLVRSNDPDAGGWHSRADLHRDPAFMFFAHHVRELANSIGNDLSYAPSTNLKVQSMWAIENEPGASNSAHVHPAALWSGVYYVQASESAGDIEFTDPRTANIMQQPTYARRPDKCQISACYQPVPGRFLIFPSWLFHFVHPNRSNQKRVIISYNLGL